MNQSGHVSNSSVLWIGGAAHGQRVLREAVESELQDLAVKGVHDGREALDILFRDPGAHLIIIIELPAAGMELAALATGIKQINPAIEIIVLGEPTPGWGKLSLPRYYRPIFLPLPCGADVLISCVAKLREIVEARENFDELGRSIRENVSTSRSSTEVILSLLDRQDGMGVIGLRRDGFFSSYNAEAQRLTGYGVDDIAHIQVWAEALLVDYDSVRALLGSIESFWAKKFGRQNMRLRIRHRDERILTLSTSVVVLLDSFGQARQLVMLFFDPLESLAVREYQVLSESGRCGFYTYLPETGFLRMSAAAMDLLNRAFSLTLSQNDILNRKVTELPVSQHVASIWEDCLLKVASGATLSQEDMFPMGLAGRRIMGHSAMARVKGGTKDSFAVVACVTAREDLLSDALRGLGNEALAEKTLNIIPRAFGLLQSQRDNEGHVKDFLCVWMNDSARELLSYDSGFGGPVPLSQIFSDVEVANTVLDTARDVCETGGARNFEMTLRPRPDDQSQAVWRFWVGKVGDGAAMFFRDVTLARREEIRLRHYRHVFSHMNEAIIVTDLEGNIIDWNPASERMFGYTKEQILGQSVFLLTESTKSGSLEVNSKRALSEGDVWTGEYEYIRSNGTRGVAFTVFAVLKDDKGEAYGTVGLCHDLTERKRLEERLTAKGQELQEKNLALNTLLRYAEEERIRACERVVSHLGKKINDRVFRMLQEKQNPQLVEAHAKLLLQEIGISEQSKKLDEDDPTLKLSEKELEVAKLIRLGKTTQEIAFILDKSADTVRLQRISIRRKLGLERRDQNLVNFLRKIDLR